VEFPTAFPQTGHFALLNTGCHLRVAIRLFGFLVVRHCGIPSFEVPWFQTPRQSFKNSCLRCGFLPISASTDRDDSRPSSRKTALKPSLAFSHDPSLLCNMDFSTTLKSALLCLACATLSSCASGHIGDMPYWMGGLPPDAPPRPGSPEYDAWMAKRAQEAARPKTGQQQPR